MPSALHTLFGFLFVIASLLHIKNNWKALRSYLKKPKEKGAGYRKELLLAILICVVFTFGGITRMPPLGTFLEIGYQMRTAQTVEQESYQRVYTRLGESASGQNIVLDIRKGAHFSYKQTFFLGMSYTVVPQMAIWVEDLQGNYLETLYVTEKAATGTWGGPPFGEKEYRRKAALPYWSHKRGVVSEDGLYLPSQANPVPDAVTAATPTGNFSLHTRLEKPRDQVVVLMEVNRSYDYNETYSEEALGDISKNYAEKDWSGQPAIVYAATVNLKESPSYQAMRVIGHSDPKGASGELFPDISKIDTALQLVDRIIVEVP